MSRPQRQSCVHMHQGRWTTRTSNDPLSQAASGKLPQGLLGVHAMVERHKCMCCNC